MSHMTVTAGYFVGFAQKNTTTERIQHEKGKEKQRTTGWHEGI